MKTTDAVLEFFAPGVIVSASAAVATSIAMRGSIDAGLQSLANIPIGGSALLAATGFAASYILGVLLSEVGTITVRKATKNRISQLIAANKSAIDSSLPATASSDPYRQYALLRAKCRSVGGVVAERLRQHESVLRLLRPTMVAIPIGLTSLATSVAYVSSAGCYRVIFMLGAFCLIPLITWRVLKTLFLQRIESSFYSALGVHILSQDESKLVEFADTSLSSK